jgi:hypothetical protein
MFLKNRSPHKPVLARGHFHDDLAYFSVNVDVHYAVQADGSLKPEEEERAPLPGYPPDVKRRTLWKGASVTASGHALGPSKPPHLAPVRLAIGAAEVRLVVFGKRYWRRSFMRDLRPSDPEPFDAVPMKWELAFGGYYEMAPGLLPGTDMPHPGGRVSFPLNPDGIGFYEGDDAAVDQPLPQIELAGQLVQKPADKPEPAALTPNELLAPALHARERLAPPKGAPRTREEELQARLEATVWMQHHAAPRSVVAELPPGEWITLEGLGERALRIQAPASPLFVRATRAKTDQAIEGRLRSLHIDADQGVVLASFGHGCVYKPNRAPSFIHVSPRRGQA